MKSRTEWQTLADTERQAVIPGTSREGAGNVLHFSISTRCCRRQLLYTNVTVFADWPLFTHNWVLTLLLPVIMRFGKILRDSIYEPWKSHYIDYAKLKVLLREDDAGETSSSSKTGREWTAADEGAFVEELVNVQLEKVNDFHKEMIKGLHERCTECESKLEKYRRAENSQAEQSFNKEDEAVMSDNPLEGVLRELDCITKEVNELEKYSRLNYAGFLKAAKKHDRRRGSGYRVRPLLQVRLAALPFNSEDYAPLLYR